MGFEQNSQIFSWVIAQNICNKLLMKLLMCKIISCFFFRSSHRRCSIKKVFLKISQNSHENTCARRRPQAYIFIKKRLQHRCFPLNFAKFLAYCMTYEMLLYGKFFVVHILNLMRSHKWYHLRISCNKP